MKQTDFYQDLLELDNLEIDSITSDSRKIILTCHLNNETCTCPQCGEATAIVNQSDIRQIRDLNISGKEVRLNLSIRQFICYPCNRYFNECPTWVESRKTYTKRQAKWIFELCAKQPFTEVAAQSNISHKTVERIYYSQAEKTINLSKRYSQVRKMGIDELSNKKGKQDYVCVLTDLERGIQLDVLPNRKKETLQAHFQALGQGFCEQIEVVACDMWKTYKNVAQEYFPNAQIVIDRFHVVKSLNDVLDKLRKKLRREFKDKDCFKNIKWQLFKRQENCSKDDLQKLDEAMKQSWELEEIYQLRNTFNAIFDTAPNSEELLQELDHWIEHATLVKNEYLDQFIKTLKNWKTQIAAFADTGVTNAVTEGLNNYLRYFKRISFGLPNFKNFRLRILQATS